MIPYQICITCNIAIIGTSGDRLRWDSDVSLTEDASKSDSKKSTDKKKSSPTGSSQAMKPKKGSWKASSSSAPLKRGGGERRRDRGGKDAKLKSEKKLSLGSRRKGREGRNSSSGSSTVVTLADLAQSVPRAAASSTSGKGTGMESPSIGNGSMGHGDQMMWKGSMELELYNDASSSSRKSQEDNEEESSLSECEYPL
jgi:hypothetical protein